MAGDLGNFHRVAPLPRGRGGTGSNVSPRSSLPSSLPLPTSAIACTLLTHDRSAVVASAPAGVHGAPVESVTGARDIDGVSAANGSCDGRSAGTCFASVLVDALGDKTDPVFLDEAFLAAFGAPLLNYGGVLTRRSAVYGGRFSVFVDNSMPFPVAVWGGGLSTCLRAKLKVVQLAGRAGSVNLS